MFGGGGGGCFARGRGVGGLVRGVVGLLCCGGGGVGNGSSVERCSDCSRCGGGDDGGGGGVGKRGGRSGPQGFSRPPHQLSGR
eukprot:12423452-Karenia_brevis.AAC.2